MNSIRVICIILFLTTLFSSCYVKKQPEGTITQSIVGDTLSAATTEDTTVYQRFPTDSSFFLKVLRTGNFHEDEVWNQAHEEKWFGLFKNKTGFYVAPAHVITSKIHDIVVDEKAGEKTGWKVETVIKDSSIILFEAGNNQQPLEVEEARLINKHVYPGDTIHIRYKGLDYTLWATGNKKKSQENPEWYEITDYKLYVLSTIQGQVHKSMLVMEPYFSDQMTTLIFAGDIDGDGIMDWVIDTTNHYNSSSYTLYLSRPAKKGELVKPAGRHSSVGC